MKTEELVARAIAEDFSGRTVPESGRAYTVDREDYMRRPLFSCPFRVRVFPPFVTSTRLDQARSMRTYTHVLNVDGNPRRSEVGVRAQAGSWAASSGAPSVGIRINALDTEWSR